MIIQMGKFGKLLNSRPTGKEVALRMFQIINGAVEDKEIVLDFSGVEILTPSFADELIHQLKERYKENKIVKIVNAKTSTVKDVLEIIKKSYKN